MSSSKDKNEKHRRKGKNSSVSIEKGDVTTSGEFTRSEKTQEKSKSKKSKRKSKKKKSGDDESSSIACSKYYYDSDSSLSSSGSEISLLTEDVKNKKFRKVMAKEASKSSLLDSASIRNGASYGRRSFLSDCEDDDSTNREEEEMAEFEMDLTFVKCSFHTPLNPPATSSSVISNLGVPGTGISYTNGQNYNSVLDMHYGADSLVPIGNLDTEKTRLGRVKSHGSVEGGRGRPASLRESGKATSSKEKKEKRKAHKDDNTNESISSSTRTVNSMKIFNWASVVGESEKKKGSKKENKKDKSPDPTRSEEGDYTKPRLQRSKSSGDSTDWSMFRRFAKTTKQLASKKCPPENNEEIAAPKRKNKKLVTEAEDDESNKIKGKKPNEEPNNEADTQENKKKKGKKEKNVGDEVIAEAPIEERRILLNGFDGVNKHDWQALAQNEDQKKKVKDRKDRKKAIDSGKGRKQLEEHDLQGIRTTSGETDAGDYVFNWSPKKLPTKSPRKSKLKKSSSDGNSLPDPPVIRPGEKPQKKLKKSISAGSSPSPCLQSLPFVASLAASRESISQESGNVQASASFKSYVSSDIKPERENDVLPDGKVKNEANRKNQNESGTKDSDCKPNSCVPDSQQLSTEFLQKADSTGNYGDKTHPGTQASQQKSLAPAANQLISSQIKDAPRSSSSRATQQQQSRIGASSGPDSMQPYIISTLPSSPSIFLGGGSYRNDGTIPPPVNKTAQSTSIAETPPQSVKTEYCSTTGAVFSFGTSPLSNDSLGGSSCKSVALSTKTAAGRSGKPECALKSKSVLGSGTNDAPTEAGSTLDTLPQNNDLLEEVGNLFDEAPKNVAGVSKKAEKILHSKNTPLSSASSVVKEDTLAIASVASPSAGVEGNNDKAETPSVEATSSKSSSLPDIATTMEISSRSSVSMASTSTRFEQVSEKRDSRSLVDNRASTLDTLSRRYDLLGEGSSKTNEAPRQRKVKGNSASSFPGDTVTALETLSWSDGSLLQVDKKLNTDSPEQPMECYGVVRITGPTKFPKKKKKRSAGKFDEGIHQSTISDKNAEALVAYANAIMKMFTDDPRQYSDEAAKSLLREFPQAAKMKFDLEPSSFRGGQGKSRHYLLSLLCALGASREATAMCFNLHPDAIHKFDEYVGTPLHYAISFGITASFSREMWTDSIFDTVEFLLAQEPLLLSSQHNDQSQSALHQAILSLCPSVASITTCRKHLDDYEQLTAIADVVISMLLENHKLIATLPDAKNFLPLHLAALHAVPVEILGRILKEHPRACCVKCHAKGFTPLHYAVQAFSLAASSTHRSGIEATNPSLEGHAVNIETLIQGHAAAAQTEDNNGDLPLHILMASFYEHHRTDRQFSRLRRDNSGSAFVKVARALSLAYPDAADTPGSSGQTPLMIVTKHEGGAAVVVALLKSTSGKGSGMQSMQSIS